MPDFKPNAPASLSTRESVAPATSSGSAARRGYSAPSSLYSVWPASE
jgi:hypothetical protein